MNYLTNRVLFLSLQLFFITASLTSNIYAQSQACGVDILGKEAINIAFESKYQRLVKSKDTLELEDGMFENLPIIFHIIHEGDSLGSVSNPRVETVEEVIQTTNDLFRQKNSQQNSFENPYYGADTKISFCLAGRDENGNPTLGIQRYVSSDVSVSFLTSLTWNREKYINVFLLNEFSEGFCGLYASGSDIIRIGNRCLSESLLSHEIGHYLGLGHVFGIEGDCSNSDCTLTGDRVCDTPPARDSRPANTDGYETQLCNFPGNSCNSDEDDTSTNNPYRSVSLKGLGDQSDPNSNIMSYATTCSNNFTQGQAFRMHLSLLNNRETLWKQLEHCSEDVLLSIDASIDKISEESVGVCEEERIIKMQLKNLGQEPLTSATIKLLHQDQEVESFEWVGALGAGQSEEVILGRISPKIGRNRIVATVEGPNNSEDEDISSNINFLIFNHFDTEVDFAFFMQSITVTDADTLKIGVLQNEELLNLNFLWRKENGVIPDSLNKLPNLTVTESDNYYLTIYTGDYTCANSFEASILFADTELDTPLRVEANKLALDCTPGSYNLIAKGAPVGSSIAWFQGDDEVGSGEMLQVFEEADYTFEARYQNGQDVEISRFSNRFHVTDVREDLDLFLNLSDFIGCNDDTVSIFLSEGYEDLKRYDYNWKVQMIFSNNSGFMDINPDEFPLFFENNDPRSIKTNTHANYSLTIRDRLTNCIVEESRRTFGFANTPSIFPSFPFSANNPFQHDTSYLLEGAMGAEGPNVEYSWITQGGNILDGASTLTPTIQGFGIYTLFVTDGGCSTEVVLPLTPDFNVQLKGECDFGVGTDQKVSRVEAMLPQNEIFKLTIEWFDTNNQSFGLGQSIIIPEPGQYFFEVSSGDFFERKHFNVPEAYFETPNSIIDSVAQIVCPGQEVALNGQNSNGTEGAYYQWLDEDDNLISDSLFTTVNQAGVYSFRIISPDNGCYSISDIEVKNKLITANAGEYRVLGCSDEIVQLGQNENDENYEFIWTKLVDGDSLFIDNAAIISVNQPGIYNLEAKNIVDNCSTIDQVEVFGEKDFVDIEILGANKLCEDTTTLLTIKNLADLYSYDLNWILPDGSESSLPVIQATEEGKYTIEYFDLQTGCEYSDTVNIKHSFSVLLQIDTLSNSISVEVAGDLGPYTYNWSNGSQDNFIDYLVPGQEYSVTVTDVNGCANVQFITYPITTTVMEPESLEEIKIYPNPSTGILNIEFNEQITNITKLKLLNIAGQEVIYTRLSESQGQIRINLNSNPAGVYILIFDTGIEIVQQKIVFLE